jgi:hypothetical protein
MDAYKPLLNVAYSCLAYSINIFFVFQKGGPGAVGIWNEFLVIPGPWAIAL